jgi:hypothetical protein
MTVFFVNLDDKLACFVVPLYRTTFVEQPLVGTVTIQDQDLSNEKREYLSIEVYLNFSFPLLLQLIYQAPNLLYPRMTQRKYLKLERNFYYQ